MTGAPPDEILAFLGEPTPAAWVGAARQALPVLAVDHANCEKKAAATAMSLMNRYPGRYRLVQSMSRLARDVPIAGDVLTYAARLVRATHPSDPNAPASAQDGGDVPLGRDRGVAVGDALAEGR